MRSTSVLALLALLPVALGAQADPATPQPAKRGPNVRFALDLTFEYGGDDFLEVLFTNGSTQKMRAGQGGTLALGGVVRPSADSPLSLRGTVGLKYSTTAADNANIMFTRVPIEMVGSYDLPNGVRFGGGVVFHTANNFDGDGFVDDATFGAATGVTAEVGYKALALTYTSIKYGVNGGASLDGSSIGVQLLWTPKRKKR